MKRVPHIILAFDIRWATEREVLRGVVSFAERHGPWDCNYLFDSPLSTKNIRAVNASDGIIARLSTPGAVAAARQLKVPIVTTELGMPPYFPNVQADPVAIGRLAAEHLIERGFRRFAYCAFHGSPVALRRGEIFVRCVESFGYCCEWFKLKPQSPHQPWQTAPDHAQLVAWVKKLPKPIGVFCVGDGRSLAVAKACRDAGILIPGQLGLIGVGNDELMCRLCSPQLSSIDQAAHNVGFEAAKLLHRMLKGNVVSTKPVVVPPAEVVVRESSDVIAIEDSDVAAAVQYIREHVADGVTVKELMQHLDVSRRKLELAFRSQLSRTVHKEIVMAKLRRAIQLLIDGRLSLPQIATQCGMNHPSRLNELLKENTGLTPLQYRKTHQRK